MRNFGDGVLKDRTLALRAFLKKIGTPAALFKRDRCDRDRCEVDAGHDESDGDDEEASVDERGAEALVADGMRRLRAFLKKILKKILK